MGSDRTQVLNLFVLADGRAALLSSVCTDGKSGHTRLLPTRLPKSILIASYYLVITSFWVA